MFVIATMGANNFLSFMYSDLVDLFTQMLDRAYIPEVEDTIKIYGYNYYSRLKKFCKL